MQLQKVRTLVTTSVVASWLVLGCSSQNETSPGSQSDASTPANGKNPDGVPYPATGFGHTARAGSTPGKVIQNFSFQGYLNGDKSKGLQTISLADYYDPCGKRLKLLHIAVAGVWCEPCNEETDAFVAAKAMLATERVVVIQALGDGPAQGVPATVTDLDNWIGRHNSNFTEMLDPGYAHFGAFFNQGTVPWNADIDPRTMEILKDGSGWSSDVNTELQPALAAIPSTPGYTIPAVCGDQ